MLDVLKKHIDYGSSSDILCFIQLLFGTKRLKEEDITILASNMFGYSIRSKALLDLCSCFGVIKCTDGNYYVSQPYLDKINDPEYLLKSIAISCYKKCIESDIIKPDFFEFDLLHDKICLRNEKISLSDACIRNLLVSLNFFEVERKNGETILYVAEAYTDLIRKEIKKQRKILSLEKLKIKLAEQEVAGEIAEKFVLEFEKRRLNNNLLTNKIRQVSIIDVGAGFDIASFNNIDSKEYDRFIEVKAVSNDYGFYWYSKEFEVAILKSDNYYLYLIELSKIGKNDYYPLIIKNPVLNFKSSQEWLMEPRNYFIKRIN